MDANRFDTLVKLLRNTAADPSRRRLLAAVGAIGFGLLHSEQEPARAGGNHPAHRVLGRKERKRTKHRNALERRRTQRRRATTQGPDPGVDAGADRCTAVLIAVACRPPGPPGPQRFWECPPFAKLSGVPLSSCSLTNATMNGVDLTGAKLEKTVLSGAKLQSAKLDNAVLKSAHLEGANLTGATLNGADVRGVSWSATTCPDGTNASANKGNSCCGHLNGAVVKAGC